MAIPGIQVDPGTLAGLHFAVGRGRVGRQPRPMLQNAPHPANYLVSGAYTHEGGAGLINPNSVVVGGVNDINARNNEGQTGGYGDRQSGGFGEGQAGGYGGPDRQTGGYKAPKGSTVGKAHPGVSPFDPEYYQNVANYLFKTNNQIAGDQQGITNDRTALQGALAQLSYAQPRAALALEEKANLNGGLYSSGYGQQQGDLQTQYGEKSLGLSNSANEKMAALISQIAGLRGSVPLYENAQALASAERLAAAAAKNPALGESKKPLVPVDTNARSQGGYTARGDGQGGGPYQPVYYTPNADSQRAVRGGLSPRGKADLIRALSSLRGR